MPWKCRRVLSYFLLATIAGISILGEGLHFLSAEVGHHHHHQHRNGLCIVTHARHSAKHEHHDLHVGHGAIIAARADRNSSSAAAVVVVRADDVDSHVCKICAYLFQALSPPIEVAAVMQGQPLAVEALPPKQHFYLAARLGPQAARGPPTSV
jgi:hypothetical protein